MANRKLVLSQTSSSSSRNYTYADLSRRSIHSKIQSPQEERYYRKDGTFLSAAYNSDMSEYGKKGKWNIGTNYDELAVWDSIDNIFRYTPGERILLPEFGSNLRQYLYEGITDFTKEQVVSEIKRSVSEYEPRVNIVEIQDISTVSDTEDNSIVLNIVYTINGLENRTYNYKYTYNTSE